MSKMYYEPPSQHHTGKLNKVRIPFDKHMNFIQKQTKADRIRPMSDEELAESLFEVKEDYQCANPEYPNGDACRD